MIKQLRKSGIDIIGDVPWGTHLCQFYQTKQDLIDILVPYFKAGLENNEFCMWITSEPLRTEEAQKSLRKTIKNLDEFIDKGQIEILDYNQWYINCKGNLNTEEVLNKWIEKEKQALTSGFDGLRLTGNTFWLERKDWKKFTDYEETINSVINKYKMLAICSYCLDKCEASDIIDVISNHKFALIRREDKWGIIESGEQKKLEENIKNLAKFPSENPNPVLRVKKNGIILYANKSSEFLLNTWECQIGGYLPKDWCKFVKDVFSLGKIKNAEIEINERIFSFMFTPIIDADYINIYGLNITEQKKTEEVLKESEEKYRTFLENLPDIVYELRMFKEDVTKEEKEKILGYINEIKNANEEMLDNVLEKVSQELIPYLDLTIIYVNQKALEIMGYSQDVMGKITSPEIMVPEQRAKGIKDILRNFTGKVREGLEYKLIKSNGESITTSINSYLTGKDFPFTIRGVARDITERKKLQQLLIQSEKMASIGILAAGIAHEINNPMGYIYSNLEMLLKCYEKGKIFYESIKKLIEEDTKDNTILGKFLELENNAKFETMFKDIKDSVEESIVGVKRVIKIITDLREFAWDEKPKLELADINQGIENALNIVWNELKYKAEIIKEFGDIPEIQCDLYKLEQVFINMLINSAHAIENHGIIKIKTFSKNNFAIIQISDTGKGIPKENILRIFDPFYTTKAPGKGTGLGLSISYKIIQEHNGKIDVDSEIGKGTTFTIKLPLKESEEFKEYKILIVDDDKNVRTLLKKIIYVYNPLILVKTAKDGFETADLLNTFIPDVIFLDIKMPGINGLEVCKRICSDKKMRNIKVIMMTGFANEFSREKCLKAGAIEFLTKPIKTEMLHNVLDKIIKE